MICSIIKKVAVREKPAKLEELILLKVRLWLVLEYFRKENFPEFWYWAGGFSSFWTGIPGGPNKNSGSTNKYTKFGQLIIRKIIKILPPDVRF